MQGLNPSLLYDDGTKSPIQILHDYYTFLSAVRSMDISGPPNHSQFNPAALRKQAACLELIYGKGGIPDAEWTYIGRPSPDGRIPYDDMGDNLSDIRQGLAADNVKLKGFAGFQERPWGGKQNDDIQHNPHTDPILDQTSYIGVPQLLKVILDAPDGGDGRRLTLHYTVYECDPTSHAYGTKYLADTYTSSKDLTLTLLRRDAPTRQGIHWMWSTAP